MINPDIGLTTALLQLVSRSVSQQLARFRVCKVQYIVMQVNMARFAELSEDDLIAFFARRKLKMQ